MKQSLSGHVSPETAFVVGDYPYGRTLRCQIRYWIEKSDKHGFRFVSQTENPKTGRWNAPKKSTYCRFAAAMYLNEEGHVKWTGLSEYSSAEVVLSFLREHPSADVSLLAPFAAAKAKWSKGYAAGAIVFTINGEEKPLNETEKARAENEAAGWARIVEALKACRAHDDCRATPELGRACAEAAQ